MKNVRVNIFDNLTKLNIWLEKNKEAEIVDIKIFYDFNTKKGFLEQSFMVIFQVQ